MNTRSTIINFSVAALLTFASPAWAQDAELDRLFDELAQAAPEDADRIAGQINTAWGRSGSPAMDLLLRRGEDALEAGDVQAALEHFSALVDHDPAFAEGYNGRATAYYLSGMMGPALEDIRQVLRLNPRHFGALRGLAIMLEELERPEDALEVYREVLALHPHAEGVNEAVDRLDIQLEGQSL
ncbi:tetratricopeptide repeat protein [Yoonia sp. R2331]|uniref:tetratricopeptide repeat protein n=1 Tax=Yoonia sp. R2331 TaxID=3237238 RepID=UPI0034E41A38